MLVAFALPVRAQLRHRSGDVIVISGHHPALAGGHVLGGVEAEATRESVRPRPATCVGAVRLASILNNRYRVARLAQRVHIAQLAIEVDRHHRPGARGDGGRNRRGVEAVAIGLEVDEDRLRTRHADARGGGEEREGGRDDFIARADTGREQRQVQRGGAVGRRERVLRPAESGEFGLERRHFRALRQRARAEDARDLALLLVTD